MARLPAHLPKTALWEYLSPDIPGPLNPGHCRPRGSLSASYNHALLAASCHSSAMLTLRDSPLPGLQLQNSKEGR